MGTGNDVCVGVPVATSFGFEAVPVGTGNDVGVGVSVTISFGFEGVVTDVFARPSFLKLTYPLNFSVFNFVLYFTFDS